LYARTDDVLATRPAGIFTEIYCPRRVAAQGTIFTALQEGYQGDNVKMYLKGCIGELIQELSEHWHILDPNPEWKRVKPTPEKVAERIEMYQSPFFGWSNYVVDGVFWGRDDKMIEEATQVIRLIFQFESSFVQEARDVGCNDVLRAMIFWLIAGRCVLKNAMCGTRPRKMLFSLNITNGQGRKKHSLTSTFLKSERKSPCGWVTVSCSSSANSFGSFPRN